MSNVDQNQPVGAYMKGQNHVIENLWTNFANTEQGSWIMKIQEVIRLHEKIKTFSPKQILELGTGIGCSTAIMAFTCPDARIYTVEQNQKCIDIAKKLIPATLQERIYFRQANVQIVTVPQVNPFIHWSMYNDFDWIDYDFILVDGPGPLLTKVKLGDKYWETLAELPNGDLINILPRLKPGAIVYVDRRKMATILYNRHLCTFYDNDKEVWEGYLEKLEDEPRFAIYRRTDKKLNQDFSNYEDFDTSIYNLDKGGYFK